MHLKRYPHIRKKPARRNSTGTVSHFTFTGDSMGTPLSQQHQYFFENHLNHNFSDVRIHTGPRATASAQALNAQAYTIGNHIFFDHNKFQPGTANGNKILAHELTHVVQQKQMSQPRIQRLCNPTAKRMPKLAYYAKIKNFLKTKADTFTWEMVKNIDWCNETRQQLNIPGLSKKVFITLHWNLAASSSETSNNTPKGGTDIEIGMELGSPSNKGVQLPANHPAFKQKNKEDTIAHFVAETIYHELAHVQNIVFFATAGNTADMATMVNKSEVVQDYYITIIALSSINKFGSTPAATKARDRISDTTGVLAFAFNSAGASMSAAVVAALKMRALEFFLQEKFAFWKAGSRFGTSPDNHLLAHSYVRNLFSGPLGGGGVFDNLITTDKNAERVSQDLVKLVEDLYKELDNSLLKKNSQRADTSVFTP